MVSTLVDLVKINVLNSGTGPFEFGSAVDGFRGVEVLTNGAQYSYSVQQDANWEFGRGTWLAETGQLTRGVIGSSVGGTAISLSQNAQVALVTLSEDLAAIAQGEAAAEAGAEAGAAAGTAAAAALVGTKANADALGVDGDADSMGSFAGMTIPDNSSGKEAIQALESAFERRPGFVTDAPFNADPTGTVDATSAINAAFAAGVTQFPPGTFKLSGNITAPETLRALIQGAGSGRTKLLFSSGGLVLPCKTAGDNYHVKGVRGLTIATSSVGTDTALRIYRSDTASIDTDILVDDVICIGSDGIYGTATGPAHYWGTLVDMQDVRFISFTRSQLHGGGAGKTAYAWRVRTADNDPQFLVTWSHLNIDGCTKAIDISGWFEGIYGSNFSIFGCRDDISYTHTGTTVGSFSIENADMFASRSPIALTNVNIVNIGKGVNAARGFIEPGYNTAFQDSGVIGNSTDGYHYAGKNVAISSAGTEGQITVDAKLFSAFSETTDFIDLLDVNTFSINAICYGAASGSGMNLRGTTRNGGWGTFIVNARGGTIATGITIAATCSGIQPGNLITDATARISDTGDILGKWRTAFTAYASATLVDKTGDGTFYTPILNSVTMNYGGGYNAATGVFTAPVAGIYSFSLTPKVAGITSSHIDGSAILVTPDGNMTSQCNPFALCAGSDTTIPTLPALVEMAVGETITPLISVTGGAKVVDVLSGIGGTVFSGHLVRAL